MPPELEYLKDDFDSAPAVSFTDIPGGTFVLQQHLRRDSEPGTQSSRELTAVRTGTHTFLWGDMTHWTEFVAMGGIYSTHFSVERLYHKLPTSNILELANGRTEAVLSGDLKRKAADSVSDTNTDASRLTKKPRYPNDGCSAGGSFQTEASFAPYQVEPRVTIGQGIERPGTTPFMPLMSLVSEAPVQHRFSGGVESITWCLGWYVTEGQVPWHQGHLDQVGRKKSIWIYQVNPDVLPQHYRRGLEHLWNPLAEICEQWRYIQTKVSKLEAV
ncbi:hypothetical protein EST38_g9995 [Candolleomyces aberdarensis]|uniref:Uncharacterized protein n=1 Tax=Candolleomyces aberdarensis TaxID=2316362 RepID=A0A4Q2D980_9AGAR|nr:hypothetical protein EST38_g9995 [Candolleomyces aberdarensis]